MPMMGNPARRGAVLVFLCAVSIFSTACDMKRQAVPTVRDLEADALVEKVIEAYGGEEALEKARAVHAKGRITAFVRRDEGTYERYLVRPGKLRVDIRYSRTSERRVLAGDRGFRGVDNGPLVEVEGPRYFSMLYQYLSLDMPHVLMTGSHRVNHEGFETVDGTRTEVLSVEVEGGLPIRVHVDAGTGRVVKTTGYFTVGGKTASLSAEFSDFRTVGGVAFPHRVVNYASGMKIGATLFEEYRVNPPLPEGFREP
jgi:hypothetical protein